MSERSVRNHYFEEVEYDPLHDVIHSYVVVIAETMRLHSLELFELNAELAKAMDEAALAHGRNEYNDQTDTRRSTREHFQNL